MTVLLLGKHGQLATMFREHFDAEGISYVALDRTACDVGNLNQVIEHVGAISPQVIINATGYTKVDLMESEGKEEGWRVNAEAVQYIAEAAAKLDIPLVHFSTDYVFDGKKKRPYLETDTTNPLSEYGKSKKAGEDLALSYAKSIVIRVSWLYGPGEQNFIRKFIAFNTGKTENNITGDEVSIPTHVSSLILATFALLEAKAYGLFHVCDKGPATGVSRAEFGRTIAKLRSMDIELKEVPMASWNLPAKRPAYSVLSTSKIQEILGREFPVWEQNVGEYIKTLD
ncbi:dTDP-4-dehydrorhamnose reductase [Candidatus Gracilibacteria bacterium CG17_big_fil_post_rev_8_21_14_2_50_48_13]|nr:MAG: dTDP-4-dehydrorhamnose reductase [Candidatus Gracilibacteria bacterium CG17_big_fil_post_rev_8_21_14_2_50_48_13]